jgi:mono/diheme cytochrome c family protein
MCGGKEKAIGMPPRERLVRLLLQRAHRLSRMLHNGIAMTAASTIVRALAAAMATFLLAAGTDAAAGDRRKAAAGRIEPAVLYHNYCSVCHGDNGDGNSRAKNSLVPAPANFTDPALAERLTREYIAAIVAHGKPRTAMVGWKTQLNEREIDALAGYVRTTFVERAGDASLLRGRSLYGHHCASCHGIDGTGGKAGAGASPRDFTSEAARRELTRDRLVAAVAVGRKGTAMKGFAGPLSGADLDAIVDFVEKSLMAGEPGAISGASAHGGRERDEPR